MSEKMIFCLGEGEFENKGEGYQKSYRIFNQEVSKDDWEKVESNIPEIKLFVTHWIEEKEMTKEEKIDTTIYKELGGYLKILSYENAWKEWWDKAEEKDKKSILDIPQFNAEIFKGITGIEIKDCKHKTGNNYCPICGFKLN